MVKSTIISLIILILAFSSASAYQGENFFVINWDGMRYDAIEDSIPVFLLDSLKQEGTFFEKLYNAWHTWTSPGHANIFTGNPQYYPNHKRLSEDCNYSRHYLPSLMETYIKETGWSAADSVSAWVFGNSPNDYAWGYSRHPDYHDYYPFFTLHAARTVAAYPDTTLWDEVIKPTLDEYLPNIIYIDFHNVDHYGHLIDPENPEPGLADYYRAIEIADSLTWMIIHDYIPNSPKYSDKTNVLVIGDHGRHSDGVRDGITNHSCDCEGCRHVLGFLWGPDFKDGITIEEEFYQTEFSHTIAHLMGLMAPHARTSRIYYQWLEQPQPESSSPESEDGAISRSSNSSSYPDLATSDDGRIHVVWCENNRAVVYRNQYNGNWSAEIRFEAAAGELMKKPKIAVLDDTVAICWERYKVKCPGFKTWRFEFVTSYNGGQTWSPIIEDVFDKAVLWSDLAMSADQDGAYVLAAACYTTGCGRMLERGALSIRKGRRNNVWEEALFSQESGTAYQYVDIRCNNSHAVVSLEHWGQNHNIEIVNFVGKKHGAVWGGPYYLTNNIESGYYAHDYFPSGWMDTSVLPKSENHANLTHYIPQVDAYPNPFNAKVTIEYELKESEFVSVDIYNLLGQRIKNLTSGAQNAGQYMTSWDAEDSPSGVYFYRIKLGETALTEKICLIK